MSFPHELTAIRERFLNCSPLHARLLWYKKQWDDYHANEQPATERTPAADRAKALSILKTAIHREAVRCRGQLRFDVINAWRMLPPEQRPAIGDLNPLLELPE
jgi:hypothetical protein